MQRGFDAFLNAPNADTLHRRAINVHGFSDFVIGQPRPIDTLVRLQQDPGVHQGAGRRLDSNSCNCFRSSGSNVTRYTFIGPHFTGTRTNLLGDPALTL
jgi:hypothetical protein